MLVKTSERTSGKYGERQCKACKKVALLGVEVGSELTHFGACADHAGLLAGL